MRARRAVATAAMLLFAIVVACHQGRRGSRPVTLSVLAAAPTVANGYTVSLFAILEQGDARIDVTSRVEWTSSALGIATLDGAPGTVTGRSPGAVTIHVRDPATRATASTSLTVTAAVLVSLAVTPTNPSIALGTTRQFVATGTFSDATTQDLTTSVTWSSSASAVATISNASGSEGLATSAATGSTTITATHVGTGIVGTTTLTVTAAVLVSLAVTPTNPSIALGTTRQFAATGTFSDTTTQDLTTSVTWSSSTSAVATISNASGTEGLATSAATGSTTITATHVGTGIVGTTTLTVTAAVLVSLAVTPTNPSIALGTTRQFAATGTFSDATTQDLTTSVTWSSSTPATATISNASGTEGLATSVAVGTTTITATHAGTGIVGTTTLTVTAAVLVSLAVTPASSSVVVGGTKQFTATGTYSDSTTQDLTTSVTWTSSTPGTATIGNASGSEGLATGVASGTTTITATDPGTAVFGSTTLTAFDDITVRASSSASAAAGTSLTITTPSGTQANDVLVAAIAVRPQSATVTPPPGWTLVRRLDNAGGAANSLCVYTRVATNSEPASHAWTFSSTTGIVGGITAFVHVDTSRIVAIENGQTTSSSLSHAAPSVTTPVANTMVVTVHSFSSAATWTPPTGMTEDVDVASQALGSVGIALEMNHVLQAAAGATGTKTAVASNDADTGNATILALRRAP